MNTSTSKKPVLDMNGKPYNRGLLMVTIIIGLFGTFLAGTMLATAYPTLMNEFNIKASTVQWLSTGFMLVTGIMIPITAWMMNRFSSKLLYIIGMGLFFIGNAICFLASDFAMLLIGRIVSALGGGILTPLGQSIAMSIYPPEKRGTIMGMVGLAIGVAPAVGPTLSGWIIDSLNWRMIFGITLPFIGLDLLLSFFYMKKVLPTKKLKLDVLSAILSIIGFGSLLYGTSEAGNYGWTSPLVIWSIIIGLIFIFLFGWRQIKLETPFLDIRLLKNWHFSLASLLGSIARIALVGVELVLPLYIQIVRGESAFHSGLMLLPGALLMGLMSPIAGMLFDRLGARTLSIAGLTLLTLGTLNFTTLTTSTPIIEIIVLYAVRVMGITLVLMPSTTAGLNALPLNKMNDGTAINNTLRQTLGAIGTAIFTTVYSNIQNAQMPSKHLLHAAPLQYKHEAIIAALNGYHAAFFTAVIFGVIGLILAFSLKKNAGLVKKDVNSKNMKEA
nr:MDR family MFS transporter [uncultured Ligilactobacillus sp.]